MPTISRPVWAEIDLNSLAHNITEVRRIIEPGSEIMAVVKANAYGHGAIQSSRVFLENGAESLAVATLTEAIELRKASITDPILIFGYTPSNLAVEVLKWNINPTIYTLDCAEALSKTAENQHATVKIHIKVDTGLGRIGFQPNEDSLCHSQNI